jgi:hypothetical protein
VIFITTGKINKKEVTVSLSGSSGFYFIKWIILVHYEKLQISCNSKDI